MLALFAAVCFVLALFRLNTGQVSMLHLGLVLLALHLALTDTVLRGWVRGRRSGV